MEQIIVRLLHKWRNEPDGQRPDTSYTKVAARATTAGFCTKQKGVWTCGHVSSVLNNRHTQRLLLQGSTCAPHVPVGAPPADVPALQTPALSAP